MAGDAFVAATGGIIGIVLGGGLHAWRDWHARRTRRAAIRAALTAEVSALLVVIKQRGLRTNLAVYREAAETLLAAGDTETRLPFPQFSATFNYFATYDALLPDIGRLYANDARNFTEFYVLAKSASEMMMRRPGPGMEPMPPARLLAHLETEERLADAVITKGKALIGAN